MLFQVKSEISKKLLFSLSNMCVALRAVAAQNFVWFDVHKDSYSRKKTAQKRQKFLRKELSANSTVIFFLAKLANFDFQGQAHLLTLLH